MPSRARLSLPLPEAFIHRCLPPPHIQLPMTIWGREGAIEMTVIWERLRKNEENVLASGRGGEAEGGRDPYLHFRQASTQVDD